MISSELLAYINEQLHLHIDESLIRSTLLAQGWTVNQVNEAFTQVTQNALLTPTNGLTSKQAVGDIALPKNTSGMGAASIVPDEIKGWNWGAFLLSWVWALGNHVWFGLLALVYPIALLIQIVLGIKGNEWAWRSKHWDSVEQFQVAQKKWAKWGTILNVVSILIIVMMVPLILISINPQR